MIATMMSQLIDCETALTCDRFRSERGDRVGQMWQGPWSPRWSRPDCDGVPVRGGLACGWNALARGELLPVGD